MAGPLHSETAASHSPPLPSPPLPAGPPGCLAWPQWRTTVLDLSGGVRVAPGEKIVRNRPNPGERRPNSGPAGCAGVPLTSRREIQDPLRARCARKSPPNVRPPHVELMPLFFFFSAFDDMLLALRRRRRLRLRAGHTATGVGRTPPGGEKWAAAAHLVHSAPACQSALAAAVPFPLWPRRSPLPLPPFGGLPTDGRGRKRRTEANEKRELFPFLSLCAPFFFFRSSLLLFGFGRPSGGRADAGRGIGRTDGRTDGGRISVSFFVYSKRPRRSLLWEKSNKRQSKEEEEERGTYVRAPFLTSSFFLSPSLIFWPSVREYV